MLKKILLVLLLLPLGLSAQQSQTIKTKAIIKKIETKRSSRTTRNIATVSFVTEEGDSIETYLELFRVPFLGSFKSVGDEVTVNYQVENPAIAKTDAGNFASKYGMYILILLGAVFFVINYMKATKKK